MAINNDRPVSPHLQIYRLPLTGVISITHRLTGVLLSIGLIFFVYIMSALAGGVETYAGMQDLMATPLARAVYWGFIYALFFHLCHGVRHLFWDAGRGFEPATLNRYAWVELAASLALTLAVFILL